MSDVNHKERVLILSLDVKRSKLRSRGDLVVLVEEGGEDALIEFKRQLESIGAKVTAKVKVL